MHHPIDRIAHTTTFDTPVVEHWLEQQIAQWVHPMKDRSDDPLHYERTLLPQSYISLRDLTVTSQHHGAYQLQVSTMGLTSYKSAPWELTVTSQQLGTYQLQVSTMGLNSYKSAPWDLTVTSQHHGT